MHHPNVIFLIFLWSSMPFSSPTHNLLEEFLAKNRLIRYKISSWIRSRDTLPPATIVPLLCDKNLVHVFPPSSRAGWEHENETSSIAAASYLVSNHGSKSALPLPSLPPRTRGSFPHWKKGHASLSSSWPNSPFSSAKANVAGHRRSTGLDVSAWSGVVVESPLA